MALDIDKIQKCLMLSQSDQDGEALSAIRKANELLKKEGKNWTEFFAERGKSKTYTSFSDPIQIVELKNRIKRMENEKRDIDKLSLQLKTKLKLVEADIKLKNNQLDRMRKDLASKNSEISSLIQQAKANPNRKPNLLMEDILKENIRDLENAIQMKEDIIQSLINEKQKTNGSAKTNGTNGASDWGAVIEEIIYRKQFREDSVAYQFLNSVRDFWLKNGRLSDRQITALYKFDR